MIMILEMNQIAVIQLDAMTRVKQIHDKGKKNNDKMSDVDDTAYGDESNHSHTSNNSGDSNRKKCDNNKQKEFDKSIGLVNVHRENCAPNYSIILQISCSF